MIVKDISFGDEARGALISGINKIADAVKSTLGARGRTVLIESTEHVGGITVTKDGVTVANSINLMDPTENLAVVMMRQAASKTASEAGDGTTTAIVLAQALIHEAQTRIKPEMNLTQIMRAIQSSSEYILKLLTDMSDQVNEDRLLDVASISANNDSEIGEIIYNAYNNVGKHGVVTVENAQGSETYCTVSEGMRIARGYLSRYFITNKKTSECVLEKPYILVLDQEVDQFGNIEQVLAEVYKEGRSILIISNLSPNIINTLNLNRARNGLKVCAIQPPQFGWKSNELMEDIAIATGATYFSESTGDNLQSVSIADLGFCDKVIVDQTHSILVRNEDNDQVVNDRVSVLWEEHDNHKNKDTQEFIRERIAVLSGRIGVIHVGANSDIEQKEKRDRVDDAVCATRAALEDGILSGGGVALRDISTKVGSQKGSCEEDQVAYAILEKALRAPYNQILSNAGMEHPAPAGQKKGYGINVKTMKSGNMRKLGIIDPTKVTKSAIVNAISVATTILSTNAIITNIRQQ